MDFGNTILGEVRHEQMLAHWVDVYAGEQFPYQRAIKAGHDESGAELYVGRCFYHGCVLPANVNPRTGRASFVWERRLETDYFQVLVGDGCFSWQDIKQLNPFHGQLPVQGVCCGEVSSGEPVYVGRCLSGHRLIVGNVMPSRLGIYIPAEENEVEKPKLQRTFQLLIKNDLVLSKSQNDE